MKKLLLLALIASFSNTYSQTKRPLKPSDVFRLQNIGDPQISPEGNWVAYTLSSVDSVKNRRNSDLWMVSWDGKESIQLTHTRRRITTSLESRW